MHVIAAKTLRDWADQHKDASTWLLNFLERSLAANWSSLRDVRRVYPHADAVKTKLGHQVIVFNVAGNKYRLITAIHFNRGKLYILKLLTHAQYDKDQWKDQL